MNGNPFLGLRHEICKAISGIGKNERWGIGMNPKKSVLIVDDEESVREALRQILKPFYEVRTASCGDEALQCVRRETIDLVTLDLRMPGMSGIEILREIRKVKDDIEVIIITAHGDPANAGEAVFYGAGDFILKPFDVSDVTAKVSRSLERRHHGLKIKNLVHEIKGLLPNEEKKNEERLLGLSKDLCETLEKGESSYPAGIAEALKFSFRETTRSRQAKMGNAANGKN
jgi:DNA-binding NtrC family response regulator